MINFKRKWWIIACILIFNSFLLIWFNNANANPYGGSGAWGTGSGTSIVGSDGTKLGVWNAGEPYNVNDLVAYDGLIYRCIQAGTGQQPDISPLYWEPLPASASGIDYLIQYADSGAMGSDIELSYDPATDTVSFVRAVIDPSASAPTFAEGTMYYDNIHKALVVLNDESDVEQQLGQETLQRIYNPSAVTTLTDGQAVYISGSGPADGNGTIFPAVSLAQADGAMSAQAYGVATHSIEPETWGWITTKGPVHDVDTSLWVPGTILYLSDTTPGLITDISPESPSYRVLVGQVLRQSVTGTIGVSIHPLGNTQAASTILNGSSLESVSVTASSDGATISAVIENSGGGDIWFWFNNVPSFFDATPAASVALTAGTDTNPVLNYVYVLQSTNTLTANTTGYPSGVQYAPIGRFWCQSAASAQTDGILMLHAETDHLKNGGDMGHLRHINEKFRQQYADYISGMAVSFSGNPGTNPQMAIASGEMFQLHRHTTPTFPAGSPMYITNDPTTPYKRITDFSGITQDSAGGGINNRWLAVIVTLTASETDDDSQIFLNLPSGSYVSESGARDDISKYSDYSINTFQKGTTMLVYRVIMRNAAGTITISAGGTGDDLRGSTPPSPGGSSVAVGTEFPDNLFRVLNSTDASKEIALSAAGITTATTRTFTAPDSDGTWALTNIDNAFGVGQTITGLNALILDGAVAGGNTTTFTLTEPTASRTITIPDSDQTIGTATTIIGNIVDISDNTNLVAGTNITLADDTLNVDDAFLLNTGDTGTGTYDLTGAVLDGASPLVFEGGTTDTNDTTFTFTTQTAARTVTWPDRSGTVAFTDQLAAASKWIELTPTTDFSTTPPSTSTITMNTDQTSNISPGMGIKYTSTANGGVCYAMVAAITSNLLTIDGVALNTGASDLTALSYSPLPGMVETITFQVLGQFATATNTTVLQSFLLFPVDGYRWEGDQAYLVRMNLACVADDTSTQPTFNATCEGSTVFSSDITPSDTTWTDSNVTAQRANYDIKFGEDLEITVTDNGGNDDLSDATFDMTFVYE